tara:strand:+ start:5 stop:2767 length:2763 start_codon:yes stop_codon:yes gene_type:complete
MSKGTVSAEELRQQLGDSLPGSVEIMARALKVSTKQLADMIKQGKVLASDALPKFARELEKTYGIENVDRVDNLVAAQGRFETSIINLVKELDAADVFKDFFEILTAGAKSLKNNIDLIISSSKALGQIIFALAGYRLGVIASTAATALFTKGFSSLTAAMAKNPFGVIAFALAAALPYIIEFVSATSKLDETTNRLADTSSRISKSYEDERVKVEALFAVIKDFKKPLEDREEAYLRLIKLYPDIVKNIDLEKASIEDLNTAQETLNETIQKGIIYKLRNEATDAAQTAKAKARIRLQDLDIKGVEGLTDDDRSAVVAYLSKRDASSTTTNIGTDLFGAVGRFLEGKAATDEEVLSQLKVVLNDIIDTEDLNIEELNKLYDELLKDYDPTTGGNNNNNNNNNNKNNGSGLDPFGEAKLRADAMEDGLEKDLALAKISYDKLKIEFIKYNVDLSILEDHYRRERQSINDKYDKIELEKSDDINQQKIDLIEDEQEQSLAQLEFDYEVAKRTAEDKILLYQWYVQQKAAIQKAADKKELAELKASQKDVDEAYQDNLDRFAKKQEQERVKRSFTGKTKYEDALFDNNQAIKAVQNELGIDNISKDRKADLELELASLFRKGDEIIEQGEGKKEGKEKDLYDLLGIDIDDKSKKAVGDAFSFAKKQLTDFANFRKQIADQNVASANKEVDSAEQALNREIAARNAGFASSVTTAEAELASKKKIQADSLKEQRAAQKEQQLIQSIEQAANLATAATQIFTDAPIWLAIPLVATMFGAFASAKVRASNLTKQYADGAYEEFDYGGSHKSGNDMSLGMTKDGRQRKVERGESMMILPKAATKKYRGIMPDLFKSLRAGTYDPSAMDMSRESDVNYWTNTTEVNNDDLLSYFRSRDRRGKKGKNVIYSNGVEIVTNGNTKTYIHG